MRNRIATILGTLLLVFTIACATFTPALWSAIALADTPPTDDTDIMIVFREISTDLYLWWCDLTADIIDNGDGTWNVYSPQATVEGVSQLLVDYAYYKYRSIPREYDGTVTALNLTAPSGEDLPHSQHIGKLVAVDASKAKPATVTRKWHGMAFNVSCLVSQSIVDMWIADTLNVGDYVVVSYIDEHPNTEEVNLVIVVDKVYDSWS